MAATSSCELLKTPLRMRLRVISPNQLSTQFSQEELVGVKRGIKGRCFPSHTFYIGVIVGPSVVEDHMDIETLGYFTVNRAEELQELGVFVPKIAGPE